MQLRMQQQGPLDFLQVDAETPHLDGMVRAADEMQLPVGGQPDLVVSVEQRAFDDRGANEGRGGQFRVVEILAEEGRAADVQYAGLAGCDGLQVCAKDVRLHGRRDRRAERQFLAGPIRFTQVAEQRGTRFRAAVDRIQARPRRERLERAAGEPGVHVLAHQHQDPDGGRGESRELERNLERRWNHQQPRDRQRVDLVPEAREVTRLLVVQDPDRDAPQQRLEQFVERVRGRHRGLLHAAFVRAVRVPLPGPLQPVIEGPVAAHDHLRLAGRAGGAQDESRPRGVVGVRRRAVAPVRREFGQMQDARARQRLERAAGVVDHRLQGGVREDLLDPCLRVRRRQRYRGGARPQQGQDGRVVVDRAFQMQADECAEADAGPLQRAGQPE